MQQFQNSNLHIHAKQNCFLKMKKELPKNNTTKKKLVRLMNPKIKILKPTAYHSWEKLKCPPLNNELAGDN